MNFNGERTNSYRFSAACTGPSRAGFYSVAGNSANGKRTFAKAAALLPNPFENSFCPFTPRTCMCLVITSPGTRSGIRNCCGHSASRVVARASRPCESCNRHTGETPVPLPFENQTPPKRQGAAFARSPFKTRKIRWDTEREEIIGDAEAAGMLVGPYRKPWDAELRRSEWGERGESSFRWSS